MVKQKQEENCVHEMMYSYSHTVNVRQNEYRCGINKQLHLRNISYFLLTIFYQRSLCGHYIVSCVISLQIDGHGSRIYQNSTQVFFLTFQSRNVV